jgi:hypothetical protein
MQTPTGPVLTRPARPKPPGQPGDPAGPVGAPVPSVRPRPGQSVSIACAVVWSEGTACGLLTAGA